MIRTTTPNKISKLRNSVILCNKVSKCLLAEFT